MVLMTDVPRDVAPVLPAASAPSPADRDRAIARLSDAFATDVLAVEEFGFLASFDCEAVDDHGVNHVIT